MLSDSWGNVTGRNDTEMEYYNVVEGETCDVTFYVSHEMPAPVVVFYRLTGFYQNTLTYFTSRDAYQLYGTYGNPKDCLVGTAMFADGDHNAYLNVNRNINDCSVGEDEGCEYMYPCGLVSNSFFNDTIALNVRSGAGESCTCANADVDSSTIPDGFDCEECAVWPTAAVKEDEDFGWDSDKDFYSANDKYGDYKNTMYLDSIYPGGVIDTTKENGLQDPRYMNWMRPAALPNFKKVYTIFDEGIPANSEVKFTVTSRFPSFFYGGRKHLVISSSNWQGPTKSIVMPWLFMGFGIYAFVAAFFIFVKMRTCPRKQGTDSYMDELEDTGDVKEFIPDQNFQGVGIISSMFSRNAT